MKAISLLQPWASAVALGSKRIETRGWATSHRGPIAIQAAKHFTIDGMIRVHCSWTWCGVLRGAGVRMGQDARLESILPFGKIVAIADLVDCRPTDSFTVAELDTRRRPVDYDGESGSLEWTERMVGDFTPGRFGWILENIRPLIEPVPVRGRQRIFNLTPEVTAQVMARVA
jgi:hypothetical protein